MRTVPESVSDAALTLVPNQNCLTSSVGSRVIVATFNA